MESIAEKTQKLLEYIGFHDPSVTFDSESNRVSIIINEGEWFTPWTPSFLSDFERLLNLIAKREGGELIYVDVNNYRKKREGLIVELAKAAARKAVAQKAPVELPPMNAYERRLVHVELASRPDIKTESIGEKGERRVVVRLTEL